MSDEERCCLCRIDTTNVEPTAFPNGVVARLIGVRLDPKKCGRQPPCSGWNHEACVACFLRLKGQP